MSCLDERKPFSRSDAIRIALERYECTIAGSAGVSLTRSTHGQPGEYSHSLFIDGQGFAAGMPSLNLFLVDKRVEVKNDSFILKSYDLQAISAIKFQTSSVWQGEFFPIIGQRKDDFWVCILRRLNSKDDAVKVCFFEDELPWIESVNKSPVRKTTTPQS